MNCQEKIVDKDLLCLASFLKGKVDIMGIPLLFGHGFSWKRPFGESIFEVLDRAPLQGHPGSHGQYRVHLCMCPVVMVFFPRGRWVN